MEPGAIYVLAGVNGAGKSSVGGEDLRAKGVEYWNPDDVAREIEEDLGCSLEEAQELAWVQGRDRVIQTIEQQGQFAFETTLGASTMARLLHEALAKGLEVRMWYVGLATVELHIDRVRARVEAGGHDIPDAKIYQRYRKSHENLRDVAPLLTELWVYDNSVEADPKAGGRPEPRLLLRCRNGAIVQSAPLCDVPAWALQVLAAVGAPLDGCAG